MSSAIRHDGRRVSADEAVAREAALEAAREEFSQQQAKAVANVRRRRGTVEARKFSHKSSPLVCCRKAHISVFSSVPSSVSHHHERIDDKRRLGQQRRRRRERAPSEIERRRWRRRERGNASPRRRSRKSFAGTTAAVLGDRRESVDSFVLPARSCPPSSPRFRLVLTRFSCIYTPKKARAYAISVHFSVNLLSLFPSRVVRTPLTGVPTR